MLFLVEHDALRVEQVVFAIALDAAFQMLFAHQDAVLEQGLQGRPLRQQTLGHGFLPQVRELGELQQEFDLLGAFLLLQLVEQLALSLVGAVGFGQTQIGGCLGCETLAQFFVHDDDGAFDHGADERHDLLHTQGVADVGDPHHRVVAEQVHHLLLVFGEGRQLAVEVGVDGHGAFAGQLHASRQRHRHHVAGIAHIVASHPFPEFHLAFGDDRRGVEDGHDILGSPGRLLGVEPSDEGRIDALAAELYHHTLTGLQQSVILLWHTVGVAVGNVQRQQYVDVVYLRVGHL